MKFPVSGSNIEFKRAPAGSHIAVCNLVVDVGLQPGSGMYPEPKHQVYIRFEIPAERVEYEKDGKQLEGPITIGMFFTASMNEKANLRKNLESWRGRAFTDEEAADFDVKAILGKACMLTVIENTKSGKTYSNIKGISPLPKGITAPTAENALLFYDDSEPDGYDDLPKWLRDKIDGQISQKAQERAPSETIATGEIEDQIPF